MVGVVVFIAVEYPYLAALVAAVLLVSGIALVVFLAKRIRSAYEALAALRPRPAPAQPNVDRHHEQRDEHDLDAEPDPG